MSVTHPRYWTEVDEDYLNDHWGVLSDDTIAHHLGRTSCACRLKAKRLRLTRKLNVVTAREVGRCFGVDDKTILSWRRRGWLPARRAGYRQGKHRAWNFALGDLEQFVRTMPWAYDRALMADGDYLTLLAARVAKETPWLSVSAAAKAAGVTVETLRRWCRAEGLPCKHRPKLGTPGGPWSGLIFVRSVDLLTWLAEHRRQAHLNRSAAARVRMLERKLEASPRCDPDSWEKETP